MPSFNLVLLLAFWSLPAHCRLAAPDLKRPGLKKGDLVEAKQFSDDISKESALKVPELGEFKQDWQYKNPMEPPTWLDQSVAEKFTSRIAAHTSTSSAGTDPTASSAWNGPIWIQWKLCQPCTRLRALSTKCDAATILNTY